jgi:hypothetical protein
MKFAKIISLIGLLAIFAMTFSACDESTTSDNDPLITLVAPQPVEIGGILTINGNYFGDEREDDFVVLTSTAGAKIELKDNADFVSWANDKIEINVPALALTGTVLVNIRDIESNKMPVIVGAVPEAVTNLGATSINETTMGIYFDASASQGTNGMTYHWTLSMGETELQTGEITAAEATLDNYTNEIDELTEGEVYTFEVYAMFDNTNMSTVASVNWSPAARYIETVNDADIYIYESSSSNGSGLDLYFKEDVAGTIFEGPQVLSVGDASNWNLGLKTSGSNIEFGSPADMYDSFVGTPNDAEICNLHFAGGDMDLAFNELPFDDESYTWAKKTYEMNSEFDDAMYNNGVIFVVRVMEPNSTAYNYAKVLIRKIDGKWLQDDEDDLYLNCRVSYQRVVGVPYASPIK